MKSGRRPTWSENKTVGLHAHLNAVIQDLVRNNGDPGSCAQSPELGAETTTQLKAVAAENRFDDDTADWRTSHVEPENTFFN